jgi:hypothetical protein
MNEREKAGLGVLLYLIVILLLNIVEIESIVKSIFFFTALVATSLFIFGNPKREV